MTLSIHLTDQQLQGGTRDLLQRGSHRLGDQLQPGRWELPQNDAALNTADLDYLTRVAANLVTRLSRRFELRHS